MKIPQNRAALQRDGARVLEFCGGISVGLDAMEDIKIRLCDSIENNAISIDVAQRNHPEVNHIGDAYDQTKYDRYDFVIGGTSCQNFSTMGDGEGLGGEKSKVFFKYLEALEKINPKWFLLENVFSMTNECRDQISEYLGVKPVVINSALLSAQARERYYWANFPIKQPEDRGIMLKDLWFGSGEVFAYSSSAGRGEKRKEFPFDERLRTDGKANT
ncbi:unnamed protein product, partial [marine sediment metagenome]